MRPKRSMNIGYAVAALSVLGAVLLSLALAPLLDGRAPYTPFFLAVLVSARYGNFGSTLLAAILNWLAAVYLFVQPTGTLFVAGTPGWTEAALFLMFGVLAAVFSGRLGRQRGQLENERERFQVTLSSIGDGVIVTDRQSRVTFMNPVAEKLTAWTSADAVGRPLTTVFNIINELDRQPVENPVARVLSSGRIIGLANHTTLINKDGVERAIDDSAAPIRQSDGRLVGVVLVFRDVSEKRRMESLRSRLSAVVESSDEAILGLALDGTVTDWNAAAERLYGYSADEILGRSLFSTIVPDSRSDQLTGALEKIAAGEHVQRLTVLRQHKSGHLIEVSSSLSPIRNSRGNIIGASKIDHDVTGQRMAERRRNMRLAVAQIMATEQRIDEAAPKIIAGVCEALDWDSGALWRVGRDRQTLQCEFIWQGDRIRSTDFRDISLSLKPHRDDGSIPGMVWQRREPVWVPDVQNSPGFSRREQAQAAGLRGGFAFPIWVEEAFIGVLEFYSCQVREADDDILETVATIGLQIGQFIERREAEAELARREQQLNDFFENAAVGLHWVGPDGKVLRVNQAELDMLGYRKEEYIGRHIAEFHADEEVIDRILESLACGEELNNCEARLRCKDGSIRHVLIDSNVYWEDGEFIHTRCFTRDITKRKQSEDSLRFLAEVSRSLAALTDYRDTLGRVATLAVPGYADWCAVHILSDEGKLECLTIRHADPSRMSLAQELYSRYPATLDRPHGPGRVIRTGEAELVENIPQEFLEKSAQDEHHLRILKKLALRSFICVPLMVGDRVFGALSFVAAESGRNYGKEDLEMAQDMAHRASIAIENARLYQELHEADRRKDEFLAMLAHELRNPLAPIRSGLDILSLAEDEHQDLIETMQQQVVHVVRLVDDLLDVSRIMRGRVELRKEKTCLANVVKRSVQIVKALLDKCDQQLSVQLPAEDINLFADPVRLEQILENLLGNASKYSDPGDTIRLSAERRDGQVRISVRDNGVGIEPELLPRVFDLFTQSSRSLDRAQGGLGIGLTLVKRLVEMHDGTVTAHSDGPGQGSEFVIILPEAEADVPATTEGQSPAAAVRRKFLIVDDNVEAAKMLSMLLTTIGDHQVEITHDGPETLARVGQMQPDIVLLDIGLPGMDGYEVARRLRQDPSLKDDILLIALTGYGQAEDKQRSAEAGFDEHVVKPLSVNQIHGLLAHPKLEPTPAR